MRAAPAMGPSWTAVLVFGFAVASGTRILITESIHDQVKLLAYPLLLVFAYAVCNRVTASELRPLLSLLTKGSPPHEQKGSSDHDD